MFIMCYYIAYYERKVECNEKNFSNTCHYCFLTDI